MLHSYCALCSHVCVHLFARGTRRVLRGMYPCAICLCAMLRQDYVYAMLCYTYVEPGLGLDKVYTWHIVCFLARRSVRDTMCHRHGVI